jgi:hypothetical protein
MQDDKDVHIQPQFCCMRAHVKAANVAGVWRTLFETFSMHGICTLHFWEFDAEEVMK